MEGEAARLSASREHQPPPATTRREEVVVVLVAVVAALALLPLGDASGPDRPPRAELATASERTEPRQRRKEPKPLPGDYEASRAAYRYVVDLPDGRGWSQPAESFRRRFDLLRTTTRRGPSGPVLVIDRTPGKPPILGGEVDASRFHPHPAFDGMIEYVFRDSTIVPACIRARCVDYLVQDGEGGGWGVLVADVRLSRARDLARRTARSLRLDRTFPNRGTP